MNTIISFPSANQSLFNSSNKPLFSSKTLLKFNTSHNITTKASASFTRALERETLYDLLGISENGTLSEIKQAYKKMALKYHPDVSPPEKAEEYTVRFIRVQEAYETLSDPQARSMYDICMANGFAFSGKRETRIDLRSDGKKRWKEQISVLQRRSMVRAGQKRGMSWAAQKEWSESCVNGSDPAQ